MDDESSTAAGAAGVFAPPPAFGLQLEKAADLACGENPHQTAALYRFADGFRALGASASPLMDAELVMGKPLSYAALLDADRAWSAACAFDEPAVVVVRHREPCGGAVATNPVDALGRVLASAPQGMAGAVVAVNRPVGTAFVERLYGAGQPMGVLVAPAYNRDALLSLATKKAIRVLKTAGAAGPSRLELRFVDGGVLVQCRDHAAEDPAGFACPTARTPDARERADLAVAWKFAQAATSCAAVLTVDGCAVGVGAGAFDCADAAEAACRDAAARRADGAAGLVCAFDMPLASREAVDLLAAQGVTGIVQPGGAPRDRDVVRACDEHGMAMLVTGVRHARQ